MDDGGDATLLIHKDFKNGWANFRVRHLLDPTAKQPLDRIRNDFGEPVAFYFAWLGYSIRMFSLLALLAAVIGMCAALSFMLTGVTAEIKTGVLVAIAMFFGAVFIQSAGDATSTA